MLTLLARVIYTPKTINLTMLTCVFHAPKKKKDLDMLVGLA